MNYEALIDPTTYGIVAGHLRNPQSQISYIFYLKERTMLAPLAEQMDRAAQQPGGMKEIAAPLADRLLREGKLLISSNLRLALNERECVDPTSIPPSANCEVIFLPPFYLVHTPGLFEGTLARLVVPHHHPRTSPKPGAMRMKL